MFIRGLLSRFFLNCVPGINMSFRVAAVMKGLISDEIKFGLVWETCLFYWSTYDVLIYLIKTLNSFEVCSAIPWDCLHCLGKSK